MEVVLVVNEVYLHPGCRDRGYLDDQRSVNIVDDDVHPGKSDNFMKLVLPFVDAAISRHERTDLLFPFLNALWQISADLGDIRFGQIWKYLRIDKQNPFYRITHNVPF